jgi:zinc/manganese transport system ATP-binding protein
VVAFEDAAVVFGQRTIWSSANLQLGVGEFVGLIGPNGTGKSTLLRVLLGQVPLARGRVQVLGKIPGRGNPAIGYVPQRRTLAADLAVRGFDLVMLGLVGDRWGFGPASAPERHAVEEAIEAVGASAYAYRPVGLLSGGEQQRLQIAQALLTRPRSSADKPVFGPSRRRPNFSDRFCLGTRPTRPDCTEDFDRGPRLLLLDEPLASLDLKSQHEIVHLVERLRVERQITVIMVAHDLNPLLEMLDGIVFILKGQVVAGSLDDVVRSDLLSELYDTPVHVHVTADGHRFVVGA